VLNKHINTKILLLFRYLKIILWEELGGAFATSFPSFILLKLKVVNCINNASGLPNAGRYYKFLV